MKRRKITHYSGPVKSSYQSPQTRMHMKKSAFLPGPGCHDLLSRHMENHYRRIAAAGATTDTSAPESLLKCTKVRDQTRRKGRSTCSTISHISRHSSQATLASGRPVRKISQSHTPSHVSSKSDAGFASMTESLESLHYRLPEWNSPRQSGLRNSTPEDIEYWDQPSSSWLNYGHLLDSPVDKERNWQLYHTRTGQLTGYKRYKQRQASPDRQHSPPWKPAFSSNSPRLPSYPSLSEQSVIKASSIPTHKKKSNLGAGKNLLETHTLPVSSSHKSLAAAPPPGDEGEGGGQVQPEEGTCHDTPDDDHVNGTVQRPHTTSDAIRLSPRGAPSVGKDVIWRTAKLSEQSQISEKRSQVIKRRVEEKLYESQYLEFISGVTRDILARGVLSDSAMALLFKSHIERNKDRLREDVMLERIQLLMKELGVTI